MSHICPVNRRRRVQENTSLGSGELLRAKFALFQTNLANKKGFGVKKRGKKGAKMCDFAKNPLKKGLLGNYGTGLPTFP